MAGLTGADLDAEAVKEQCGQPQTGMRSTADLRAHTMRTPKSPPPTQNGRPDGKTVEPPASCKPQEKRKRQPPSSAYFFLMRASLRIHGPYSATKNTAVAMPCMVSKGNAAAYTMSACAMDCGW